LGVGGTGADKIMGGPFSPGKAGNRKGNTTSSRNCPVYCRNKTVKAGGTGKEIFGDRKLSCSHSRRAQKCGGHTKKVGGDLKPRDWFKKGGRKKNRVGKDLI